MATWLFGSYETVKYVHIEDARLGSLRLLFLLAIAAYVGIVEMAQIGGYLEANTVVGVVRFSLQQPTKDRCDPSTEGCINEFLPLNELEYCQQAKNKTSNNYPGNIYDCHIYEAVNTQVVRETSMVIWTRAITHNQSLVCDGSTDSGVMTCPRTYENEDRHAPSRPFYIAQSEGFTIMLEHSVTASQICERKTREHYSCSAQASQYQGRLYTNQGGLCRQEFAKNNSFAWPRGVQLKPHAPCYVGANSTNKDQDFFSLDVLFRATGFSLDDCVDSNQNSTETVCTTYRESGATLLLNVVWNDFRSFKGLVEPFYYYSPQLIGDSYKESIPFYHSYRSSRTLMRAHGVKVAVVLAGSFHQFQILPFLITLTTAVGLLAVSTTVVDSLMLYVLPEKERYHQVKYELVQGEAQPSSPFSMMGRGLNQNTIQNRDRNSVELLVSSQSREENDRETEFLDDNNEEETSSDLREPLL